MRVLGLPRALAVDLRSGFVAVSTGIDMRLVRRDGTVAQTFDDPGGAIGTALAFSADGSRLAAAEPDLVVDLYCR